jgi:hypothetical protein
MFGATKRLGEKLAVAMETEGQKWIDIADRTPETVSSLHNRYAGVVLKAIGRVIRDVTNEEKESDT